MESETTHAFQATPGSPKPASPTLSFPVLGVLQPRVVSKCIWQVFCVANVREQVAWNNWPAGIAWVKLLELTIIRCMKWNSYAAVVHQVCVCAHTCTPCAHLHTCSSVAAQNVVFCFCSFSWFIRWKFRNLGLNHKGTLTGKEISNNNNKTRMTTAHTWWV